jgi:multiple sugar transport system ATP-binding protein
MRKPPQLSGGQRQRVAMGRALVREPAVFLMDEPLSNLDANLRVQMRSEVLRVQRRLGVAALYVTHDQTEAMTMGDRVAVLRDGTLQQLASPQELYECPTNLFVASFIGSPPMNLYEAEISGAANELVLSLGSQRLALPADTGKRYPGLVASAAREIVVGIRPEYLTITAGGDAAQGATLAARVELVELLGNESLVHFSTDARTVRNRAGVWTADDASAGGEIAAAAAAEGVARVDPRVPVAVGDRVALTVDVSRLSFFDAETGEAIGAASGATAPQSRASRKRTPKQAS